MAIASGRTGQAMRLPYNVFSVEKQVAASASFPNPEKCFERAGSQRFPDLDHFIGDDCGERHSEPNKNRFDRQAGPRPDVSEEFRVLRFKF